jgi:hypothetical protein
MFFCASQARFLLIIITSLIIGFSTSPGCASLVSTTTPRNPTTGCSHTNFALAQTPLTSSSTCKLAWTFPLPSPLAQSRSTKAKAHVVRSSRGYAIHTPNINSGRHNSSRQRQKPKRRKWLRWIKATHFAATSQDRRCLADASQIARRGLRMWPRCR